MTVEQSATNTEATGAAEQTNDQATSKTFTQDEVNAILAKTKSQMEKKFSSKFEDLGDPNELREIVTNYRKQQQEAEVKRGNFDKLMAELASKKDAEISKRDNIIREFRIEQPLVTLAAQYRSVNPEQVKTLLKPSLRLNDDGEVEVIDTKTGEVRYQDNGKPYTVDAFVKEFLDQNPHFVSASPATVNTQGNVGKGPAQPIDISKLDLTRADHRKLYAEARRNGRI